MIQRRAKTPQQRDENGRVRQVHHLVWENANGPIKPRHRIYFKNGDVTDTRLSNLAECTDSEFAQRQQGATKYRGTWRKPCTSCGEQKPINAENWYLRVDKWPNGGRCRACRQAEARKTQAKTRRKHALAPQPPA